MRGYQQLPSNIDFLVSIILGVTIACPSIFICPIRGNQVNKRISSHNFATSLITSPTRDEVVSFDTILAANASFTSARENLFVLLHIQKTGGTAFEKHLVEDLAPGLSCACSPEKRRCRCPREDTPRPPKAVADITWLVSRFSTGWICGLHPDFTQLKKCLRQERRLHFLTLLRHPLRRFVSEFRHVQRGATWKASKTHCEQHDTKLCLGTKIDWSDVSLEEFIECPNNMAINRQTKMLADLDNRIACSGSPVANNLLLASAMVNLERLAYFGLCEQQRASQILFQKTFKLRFSKDFSQSDDNRTQVLINDLPANIRDRIVEVNSLDMRLYNFALDLFAHRCKRLTNSPNCIDLPLEQARLEI